MDSRVRIDIGVGEWSDTKGGFKEEDVSGFPVKSHRSNYASSRVNEAEDMSGK
jgi:hypothetical protein